jgi:GT2 family glycosyltransferase
MKPGVTIVVPVFNGEDYLRYCLRSLMKQSFRDFDVIIVDDGSRDESPNIADKFCRADARFRLIRNEMNKGLPASLNIGSRESRRSHQTWISHDNVLGEDWIESMYKNITQGKEEIVYSDYFLFDSFEEPRHLSKVESDEFLFCGNVIGASFIYSSEVFMQIGGYDESKFLFEDYDFFVRAKRAGFKFRKIPIQNYFYRVHNQQLSSTHRLPKHYYQYRLSLIEFIPNNYTNVRARAIISLLHVAWSAKAWQVFVQCLKLLASSDLSSATRYLMGRMLLRFLRNIGLRETSRLKNRTM